VFHLALQFSSFAAVGAIATLLQYFILVVLVSVFSFDAVLSSAIGFVTSAFLNYYLNYRFTFKSSKRHRVALVRFFIIASLGLLINTLVMKFLLSYIHLPYLLSQVGATGMVMLSNFILLKKWAYS
jgi:putative flippase GtrA